MNCLGIVEAYRMRSLDHLWMEVSWHVEYLQYLIYLLSKIDHDIQAQLHTQSSTAASFLIVS